jgi:hypothetical protein
MIAALLALLLEPTSSPPPSALDRVVAELGGAEPWAAIEEVSGHGCAAVPALVRALRVVKPGRYRPGAKRGFEVEHAMWVYAALRRIAGRDFYGRATARQIAAYSPAGRQFLRDYAPPGEVKPFGLWLSHGILYFAPAAAQREIIASWRDYAALRRCRDSSAPRPPPDSGLLTGRLS